VTTRTPSVSSTSAGASAGRERAATSGTLITTDRSGPGRPAQPEHQPTYRCDCGNALWLRRWTPPQALRAQRYALRESRDEQRLPGVRPRPSGQEQTLIPPDSHSAGTADPPEPELCTTFDQKGSAMTHVCCPRCRLRFSPAASAYITDCPECGEPPQHITNLESALGFRLLGPEDLPIELPQAVAVSLPAPEPGTRP
jgi:hypothetical protein